MHPRTLATLLAFASIALAQRPSRPATIRARITGGGGDGKCTFEVVVDDVAEVEIRDDRGTLRTISGNPSTWRRLDCNQPLPRNPVNFRFNGIDGRGRQFLVRDPNSNRGTAVIRIEDPRPGAEAYTGDLLWSNFGSGGPRPFPPPGGSAAFPPPGVGGWGGAWDNRWGNLIQFSGRGRGAFNRHGGPNYTLRAVRVTVDRARGEVTAAFDTNFSTNTLSFIGRISRVSGDIIDADLVSAMHLDQSAQARGNLRVRVASNRNVRSVDVNGDINSGRFNLNWRG
ncbi:MAG: hypothetical protein JO062_21120 [Bryobacterales bacterium]|nr:hypothetical protein [Bryobacterales bacterium]